MSEEMDKLAAKVPGIMATGAAHMRKIAQQNVDLVRQNQALTNEIRVMKLARRMEDRGIQNDLSFEEKIAALRDADPQKLASMEGAVEISAGGFTLGALKDRSEIMGGEKVASIKGEEYSLGTGESDPLDTFVLSGAALG